MLKILFYHANDTLGYTHNREIFLGVASLYLNTYLNINKPSIAKQVKWLVPQQEKLTDDELIEKIEKEQPDLFCTAHYIWNNDFISKQVQRIKPRVDKNILFVAGGPSVDVNINDNFFQDNPAIDYALYGAGEAGFSDLLESILTNKKLLRINTSNIAWFDSDKNKQIVADFVYVPQLKISPYTTNADLLALMTQDLFDKKYLIVLPYELTRGCPYSCTFCDWNSGLTNKTTRRKGTYEEEIDLFHKLGIKGIYFADANVGQYQEDIDMVAYLAKKNIEEGAGFKIDGNFSKLRKENNLKIYHILAKGDLVTNTGGFTISVQDTNETILKNIDRPDVGWDVHANMIKELKDNYPHKPSVIQLIQGLPGQSVITWKETLDTVIEHATDLQIFVSELLPASPAARDLLYQEKWKFKYSNARRFNGTNYFTGNFTQSCESFNEKDFAEMTTMSLLYNALAIFRRRSVASFDVKETANSFIQSVRYNTLVSNLYNNWINKDKFVYTLDFGGKSIENPLSACHFRETAASWANHLQFTKLVASHINEDMTVTDFIKQSIKIMNGKVNANFETNSWFT
jgi:radical SAM superfamily enzyme YgiQ (UPF0313 family)